MPLHTTENVKDRKNAPRVFFYVQHLLGTGHLRRSALLADAMHKMSMEVHVISGGRSGGEMPGDVATVQLPPLRAKDPSFSALVDESGAEPGPEWLSGRRRLLLDQYRALAPDVVVIESFPFGRRKLRFELIPLLEEIHRTNPRPLVACSVRDIVQARKPARMSETVDLLLERFDHVLVHGDPGFVRLEESFAAANRIAHQIHYSGYVASPPSPTHAKTGREEVLVSGGGGAVSARLLATAIEAHAISRHSAALWRILAGPNIDDGVFETLRSMASHGVRVERNRADFTTLLRNCSVSISQCGYNTALDLIQAGARSIVVPFEGEGETEQLLRARKLEECSLVEVVTEKELSPEVLAAAIDRRASGPRPSEPDLDLDGAAASARFLLDTWLNRGQYTH